MLLEQGRNSRKSKWKRKNSEQWLKKLEKVKGELKGKESLKTKAQKTEKQRETQGSCK